MGVWSKYENRMKTSGATRRDSMLNREIKFINNKLPHSLSYHTVNIDNVEQNVAIINTDILTMKFIFSMPGEVIPHGALVYWEDCYWLVTEIDVNNEVYMRAKMEQCNYLLKWIDDSSNILEQWCIIEDGTKYLVGEFEDRNFVITRGDSRIQMRIARNENTIKFNRESRFLIDDPDSKVKLSYQLTKPMKLGNIYNGNGVYSFVLQETNSTDFDNHELAIPDYYKHFPRENTQNNIAVTQQNKPAKKGWI